MKLKKMQLNIVQRTLFAFLCFLIFVCTTNPIDPPKNASSLGEDEWVDSIFNALSADERLGQLFMIRAHSNKDKAYEDKVANIIKDYHVGGLCFFQGTPEKQARLTNEYQKLSPKVALMLAMDAEWGLGMRLKSSTISFPKNLTLGAIQDNKLVYDLGKEIAIQCRRLGVHINFAPVADVNNNPENPVINTRSFGEDRLNVAGKAYMIMKGMQDQNVMACAKHFPGHGDTDKDSHYDLPVITHDMQRLDSIELFPFKILAEQGVQSMMIAHLHVPSIDNTPNLPTTLSATAIKTILNEQMNYDGLIFTDGLGMKGVTKHHKPGELEAKALIAGNDILLLPQDIAASFVAIKKYIADGKLSQAEVDRKVKKVLRHKYRLKLTTPQQVDLNGLSQFLNRPEAMVLKRKLIANALTLVRNEDNLVPIKNTSQKISTLSMGASSETKFQNTLNRYADMQHFQVSKEVSASKQSELLRKLKDQNLVIVGLHDMSSYASKKFGLTSSQKSFLKALNKEVKVILTVFGNPYALKDFDDLGCILVAYEEGELYEHVAAQALFGAMPITGRLPVTASPISRFNDGFSTASLMRLEYGIPESVGLNGTKLEAEIDALAKEALDMKATPGCVILIAKNGKVVFEKSYGYHTAAKKQKMTTDDIFDLASITKIAATTLSMMKLYDQGDVNIFKTIGDYLPEFQGTNKQDMVLQEIMAHRAGLKPWIPFFEQTLNGSKSSPKYSSKFYKTTATDDFSIPVTGKLFMKNEFVGEIKKQIRDSELRSSRTYKYSDLGFYILSDIVQKQSGNSLATFADQQFYKKLGLRGTTFNAANKFSLKRIVPSEDDRYWRRQKVHGYVHDMGSAMLGGISGHAGLFATANDVAVIMQMLLNRGYYGGEQFLQASTVQLFTTRHSACTRRGIGFDMKEMLPDKSQNMCAEASNNTFGHLGFTGTVTWADPDQNIVYVFLSNRTYPSMKNNKLGREDFRPRIQSAIYNALIY